MPRRRRWGSGTVVRPTSPGGPWAIRYQTPAGRAYESGFASEVLARQALEARRVDAARERIGLPVDRSSLPTIAALGDEWIAARLRTHRGATVERRKWRRHVRPTLGNLRIPDLDVAAIRRYVEAKRGEGLSGSSVRGHVAVISALYEWAREQPRRTGATGPNPCHDLPTSIAVQLRSATDPRTVPFVDELADVRQIYDHLPEPIRTGYAVGVLAGLRTGEVRALRWEHVDLDRRQITVQRAIGTNGQEGPVKDSEARVLPLSPDLLSILRSRHLATGGRGIVVPPRHPGRPSGPRRTPARYVDSHTLGDALRAAMPERLHGRGLDWYRCTRHTYASHYVLGGGDLHHLSRLLGHSSAEVTLRYAHLQPQRLAESDVDRIGAGLSAPRGGPAVPMSPVSAGSLPDTRRSAAPAAPRHAPRARSGARQASDSSARGASRRH